MYCLRPVKSIQFYRWDGNRIGIGLLGAPLPTTFKHIMAGEGAAFVVFAMFPIFPVIVERLLLVLDLWEKSAQLFAFPTLASTLTISKQRYKI